jgi:cytochrome P450
MTTLTSWSPTKVEFFALALLIWLTGLIVSRLLFHPLRKFPGDKLAALTGWYREYYDLAKDGDWVEQLGRLHRKYGPVVRVAPNELHFSDPKVFRDIYTSGSKLTKDPAFYHSFDGDESSFTLTDPNLAKIRRKVLEPLFSRRAVLKLEVVVQEKVDTLVDQLMAYKDEPVNMSLAFRSTTLDIITSYSFDRSYGALTFPSFQHPLLVCMQAGVHAPSLFKAFPIAHRIFPLLLRVAKNNPVIKGFAETRARMSAQIEELLADPGSLDRADHEIIYHHLMTPQPSKGQPEIPTKKSLLEEAMNLMFAGSDTVGNATTFGTFLVLSHERVYSKLFNELKEAWPDKNQPMRYEVLEKLPYLTAVIKESVRMAHGVVTPLPRVVPEPSAQIGGMTIPAVTTVSIGFTFILDNADIFSDPMSFMPERWLQPNSRELENYLVSFSRGPRSCIGINLAWCELYLIFGNVFRKLAMTIHDTSIDDFKYRAYFLPTYSGRAFQARVAERVGN